MRGRGGGVRGDKKPRLITYKGISREKRCTGKDFFNSFLQDKWLETQAQMGYQFHPSGRGMEGHRSFEESILCRVVWIRSSGLIIKKQRHHKK